MARRYFSSTAVATTLSGNVNNSATSIDVTALSGFPNTTPWTAILDKDTASEEVVTVTNVSGTTLTVTRGVDGTSAVSHNAGASFSHGVSARDFDEANSHVNDTSTDVHSQYVIKSLVNAKGDLVTATANDTPAILTAGSNGQMLMADSSATAGLRWQPLQAAGRNFLLNSDFSIWQRGTSNNNANAAGVFLADRWQIYSGTSGRSSSRQTTGDTTNLPNIRYCHRFGRDSGNTATNTLNIFQNIETSAFTPLSGQAFVLSFYARRGANYSATSNGLTVRVIQGTGTDENGGYTGYTGESDVTLSASSVTLTTAWQRFTVTGTFGATSTEGCVLFRMTPSGTAGAADYFEVTGVQLEAGGVATAYQTATGNPASELAACQRYYTRFEGGTTYATFGNGYVTSTTNANISLPLPTPMRVAPTSVDFSNLLIQDSSAGGYAISAVAISTNYQGPLSATVDCTIAGATAARYCRILNNNNTGGYLGLSAEL